MEKEVKKAEETQQQTSTTKSIVKNVAKGAAVLGVLITVGYLSYKAGQKHSASASNGTGLPVPPQTTTPPVVEAGEPQKWQNPQPQKWHNK